MAENLRRALEDLLSEAEFERGANLLREGVEARAVMENESASTCASIPTRVPLCARGNAAATGTGPQISALGQSTAGNAGATAASCRACGTGGGAPSGG